MLGMDSSPVGWESAPTLDVLENRPHGSTAEAFPLCSLNRWRVVNRQIISSFNPPNASSARGTAGRWQGGAGDSIPIRCSGAIKAVNLALEMKRPAEALCRGGALARGEVIVRTHAIV
jgi:hypothetical protein